MSGVFWIPRGLLDRCRPEKFTYRDALTWSIEHAAVEPGLRWHGRFQVRVERGELVTSIRDLARRFDWSEKAVRSFIAFAQREGLWFCRPAWDGAQAPTVVAICGYAEMQACKPDAWSNAPSMPGASATAGEDCA